MVDFGYLNEHYQNGICTLNWNQMVPTLSNLCDNNPRFKFYDAKTSHIGNHHWEGINVSISPTMP